MRDWIYPEEERVLSPNRYRGRAGREIDLLVLHYAVDREQHTTDDAADVARGFSKDGVNRSAHFVIGRDRSRRQCVPLSDGAWHAGDGGRSKFPPDGLAKLSEVPRRPREVNRRSVGVELCNVGYAVDKFKVPPDRRVHAKHPAHRTARDWEMYTQAQIAELEDLVRELVEEIPTLRWVTGHEDVTNRDTLGKIGGKVDPSPAMPWWAIDWGAYGLTHVCYSFAEKAWVEAEDEPEQPPVYVPGVGAFHGPGALTFNGGGSLPRTVDPGP